MDILVVVFAYNEQENLEQVVREVRGELDNIAGSHEVLIVNDGSTDRTGEIAAMLALELSGVRVVEHAVNLGLGGAYRTGFANAKKELISFWPADGQFSPAIIGEFAGLMEKQDLVLGFLPNRKRTPLGRFLSFGEQIVYRVLFGSIPKFQGIFMLRSAVLDEITLTSSGRGWAIVIEMIIKVSRGNYRIRSVPTDLRPRMEGESKVTNLRTIASNLQQIVALRKSL